MRGAILWLSLALLTLECCAATTNGVGADASPHDAFPSMDASDALTVDASPLAAPRPIAPLSTATVTAQNPTLHWSLAPGTDGAHVQICHDRACTTVEQTLDSTGNSVRVPTALAPGVHFWRIAARVGTTVGTTWSPTWEFFVGHRSAPVDSSFGTVPDFNGDGFADVVVGGGNDLFVYSGAARGASSPPTVLSGATPSTAMMNAVVASAGDVNGDGFGDVVVGGQVCCDPEAAFVFLGGFGGITSPPIALTRPSDVMGFAFSLAGAGDINGDGYADVVIGSASGAISVFLGTSGGLSLAPTTLGFGAGAGTAVAGAGDINGDGFDDVALVSGTSAYLLLGGSAGVVASPSLLDANAFAMAGAGDINGDGFDDVIAAGYQSGTASIYLGAAPGPSTAPIVLTNAADPSFGDAVASLIAPLRPYSVAVRPSHVAVRPSRVTVRPSRVTVRPSHVAVRPSPVARCPCSVAPRPHFDAIRPCFVAR